MQGPRVHLSVVVPVYGCRSCLHALHERLSATLAEVTSAYEIVYVDDGTEDGTWPTLRTLARTDAAVRATRLSRNFGQQAAIVAGSSPGSVATCATWVVSTAMRALPPCCRWA